MDVMRSKLNVIENIFRVGHGVMVVDKQVADWLSRIFTE